MPAIWPGCANLVDMSDKKNPIQQSGTCDASIQQEASVPAESASSAVRASTIRFHFDDASRLVEAHLTPSSSAKALSLPGLREQLEAAGFGDFYAPEASLASVVQKANNGEEGTLVVAEQRDATLEWFVTQEKQALYLTLHRAWGGRAVTRDYLQSELSRLGVPDECVLPLPFDEIVAMGQAERQLLAKAIAPQDGEDTQFRPLTESDRSLAPSEDEKGRVDMHQLHDFIVVEPGTPLMRRMPATDGKPGVNVVGEVLEAKPGRELSYTKDCDGTEPSAKSPDILVATIKGHPVMLPCGVRVDPVLKVKNVDLSTGNVDFDGSIEVAGDVTSGFVLKASGDICVRGMVEAARVESGKNLLISGGVMGEEGGQDAQGHTLLKAQLRAGQDLSAKFINLAQVSVGRDLAVKEYVLQSQLSAGRDLLMGQPTGKGSVMGGRAKAGRAVVANILGSEANVATELMVGKAARKRRLMSQLRRELELSEHNWHKLTATLEAIESGQSAPLPEAKLTRLHATATALRRRRLRLQGLIERLAARQGAGSATSVHIKRQLYANVSVTIDGVRHTYNEDQGPSRLVRAGAELVNRP